MTWFTAGAAVIVVFFAINAIVFASRAISKGRAGARELYAWKMNLPAIEIGVGLSMIAAWLVGLALPIVAPGSAWGQAMTRPWALPSLCAWSMFASVVAVTIIKLVRKRGASQTD